MLIPQIVGTAAVQFMMAVVLAVVYLREPSPHLKTWAFAFTASGVRHSFGVFSLIAAPYQNVFEIGMLAMLLLSGFFLIRGTYEFLEKDLPRSWYGWLSGVVVLTGLAIWQEWVWHFQVGPAFIFRGLSDIFTGVIVLRYASGGLGRLLAGWSFILWGLHRIDFPFLRHVEWFAPWGYALAAFLAVGTGLGILALHYETTRQKLGESEQKFRLMFENALDGYLRCDLSGIVLAANPALLMMLGYDSEQIESVKMSDIWAQPHGWHAVIQSNGEAAGGLEAVWKRADGRLMTVFLRLRKVRLQGRDVIEGSVRDITHTKVLQEQLDLARRLDAVGRLAGGIAHDFNNVLTAILAGADMVEMEIQAGRDPTEDLDAIRLAARRAADLSSHLLAFSRQEFGKPAPIAFDKALEATELMLRRLLPSSIRLDVERNADVWVMAERGQFERVILNLATNAQDAMVDGGVLSLKTFVSDDRGLATLVVRDNGVGIDPKVLSDIFTPYFTTKTEDQGTGLGLANVYRVVEAMGGMIEVESKLGEGTEFRVTIPTCSAIAPEAAPDSRWERLSGSPLVLLVEDRDIVRHVLTQVLERIGCRVIVAENGQLGVQVAMPHLDELAVVVTDVVMPEQGGVRLIEELRALKPDLKHLYISGYTAEEFKGRGLEHSNFLAKPFNTVELVEKLRVLLKANNTRGV